MKILLIGLMLLGLAAPVQSNDLCNALSNAAEAAMKGRQSGLSKSTLESVMRDVTTDANQRRLVQELIDRAYEVPRRNTEARRNAEVRQYSALWESACYKSIAGQ